MEIREQKNIINALYAMIMASTILSFIPVIAAQLGALVLFLMVLIAAYVYKSKDDEDGLLHNHMTYLIRTIWIGSTFLVLAMIVASFWIAGQSDNTALQSIVDQLGAGQMLNEETITAAMKNYISDNQGLLLRVTLATIGPAMIYFVYRIANGFSRAWRGYRIAKPKGWL